MIRPLLAKEWRDQRPFLGLALFFLAADVLSTLWTEPLGFSPYAATFLARFKVDGDLTGMTCLLAFALGTGLLVRERDDRTLEFLDALPTTRGAIFAVKVLVAVGVVLVYPLGLTVWTICEQALAHPSLDPGLHLDVMGVGTVLRVVQVFTVLSLSLALAPLRRLSWTVLAVLMLGLSVLRERVPWLSALDPLRLAVPHLEGARWTWPVKALVLQLALACALLALALAGFVGMGERLTEALQRRLQGTWVGGLVTVTTVAAVFTLLARWGMDTGASGGDDVAAQVRFPLSAMAHADTRHYQFTYPASLSGSMGPLLEGADPAFETVRALLDVEAGQPVRADLGGSERNTAGTAYWNTLRMEPGTLSTPHEALAVLGHETTHVLAQRRMGPERAPRLSALRALSEGLASYVEYRFFRSAAEREADEVVAAAMRARREVRLEELLEPEELAARRDANLVYPLGRLFVEALVRRSGDGAPARVLTALGRADAPENLQGTLAWQDAFQTARLDLSRTADDFFALLDERVEQHRALLDALPRPRGALEREDARVGIRVLLDHEVPEGWTPVCRFRVGEKAEATEFEGPFSGEGPHWREPEALSDGALWYQLGLRAPGGRILYEPWIRLRVE
jgi:hypothetical protein